MSSLRVSMIGTGYVGLVDAAALAYVGYDVTCVDTDVSKISKLKAGVLPIFEPFLKELVEACGNRLKFTSDYSECVPQSDVVFIAVGTPSSADGSPNLEYLQSAAGAVGRNLGDRFTVVVNKSTVPI